VSDLDAAVLEGAFADPARDAQRTFRAILAALSEPGTIRRVDATASPPAPFPPAMGAVALTLCDGDTAVWLSPSFGEAAGRWIAFHTGAPVIADRGAARFVFQDAPDLAGLDTGLDAYPDRSATLVAPARFAGPPLTLSGPGVPGRREAAVDLSQGTLAALADNRALFPRGVDLILVDGDAILGLPRSTEVTCTSR